MIMRHRLLAAAGLPVRAAAQPADPDGTVPAPLTTRGAAGQLEPGFRFGQLTVSWSGATSAGNVRFRTAVAFLARPLGSVLFGRLGDRVGRKRTLIATLSALGLLGVVCGLALPETRHRSLRGATLRPALAEG